MYDWSYIVALGGFVEISEYNIPAIIVYSPTLKVNLFEGLGNLYFSFDKMGDDVSYVSYHHQIETPLF